MLHFNFANICPFLSPDVELAIEQYKKDKQERERLQKENERLLSLEHEYKEAVERIEFEKTQLEEERRQLQEMEEQHRQAVESFEEEIAVQIVELERQRKELRHFEEEKEKLMILQEKYEENVRKQEQERSNKEKRLVCCKGPMGPFLENPVRKKGPFDISAPMIWSQILNNGNAILLGICHAVLLLCWRNVWRIPKDVCEGGW